MSLRITLGAALTAIALLTATALGATRQDWDDCVANNSDRSLAGCTRIIDDRSESQRNHAVAYYNRGAAWKGKGDLDQAIADYTEAIRLDAVFARAYANRGLVWHDKGELDRAIADYTDAIRLDPKHAIAYNSRGLAWKDKGELDRAIADFTEAVRLDPKYALAYNNRGLSWRAKGELDRAVADYTDATRFDPNYANAYNNRGVAWRAKGDFDRAIADFTEATRLNPKLAVAYRNNGTTQFHKGDFAAAAAALLRANEIADNAYAMLWRYLARGRLKQDGAAELAANAVRLKGKDWPYAVIDFYLGRRPLHEMMSAAGDSDERCQAQFYLGEWQVLKGNAAEARTALQIAVADTCPKTVNEYDGAVWELKRLAQ